MKSFRSLFAVLLAFASLPVLALGDAGLAELQRIQSRGTHVHFNIMRKVRPEEIPVQPKRKFRVVF